MTTLYWIAWAVFIAGGMWYGSGGRQNIATFFRLRREARAFEAGCAKALLESGAPPASAGMVEDLLRAIGFAYRPDLGPDRLTHCAITAVRHPRRYFFPTKDRWDIRYMLGNTGVCSTVIVSTKGELRAALMEFAAIDHSIYIPWVLGVEGANPLGSIALRWYMLRRFLRRRVRVWGYSTRTEATGGWCFQITPALWFRHSTHGDDVWVLGACWLFWGGGIEYTRPLFMRDRIMSVLR